MQNLTTSDQDVRRTDKVYYSELRYRRLFAAARDGIILIDPQTRQIVDVNPFLLEFLGYTFDELIGKELHEIGLLKDEAASRDAVRELLANGYIRYDDLPLETKDGRKVDVEFVSNLYQEGDQQIIQCNVRDVSGRRMTEAAVRHSEERFKLAARAVCDVVWDWNLLTDSLWWSDNFMSIFGYVGGETEPDRAFWTSRIHPDDFRQVVDGIHESPWRVCDSREFSWERNDFQCIPPCRLGDTDSRIAPSLPPGCATWKWGAHFGRR